MNKHLYIIGEIFLIILFVLSCYEGFLIAQSAFKHYQWFSGLAVGMVAYVVLHRIDFIRKNEGFTQTFSHEFTHAAVGILFFRKIHSLHADSGTGAVTSDGANIFSTLAPYCLPIFTYLLLLIRCFVAPKLYWGFDILVGLSLAFHIHCFKQQTGNYQTDITSYPLYLAYSYIITFWVFNFDVIVCSLLYSRSLGYKECFNIIGAFQYLGSQFWGDIVKLFT